MPNISIKEKYQDMMMFRDASWYFRQLGKCIYKGYVPFEMITGWDSSYGMGRYANFSDYWWKGDLVTRKTLNLPMSITKYILDNMYAETPQIEFGKDKDQEYMNDILIDNSFAQEEKRLHATKINVGDYVLKPYICDNKIKIDYVIGDMFYATNIDNKQVVEGVFITVKEVVENKKKVIYRRLEWHIKASSYDETYINGRLVKYEIWKSKEARTLGKQCNLNVATQIFGEKIEEGIEEYLYLDENTPTFVLGINPQDNNKDWYSGRGLGWFMNTLDTIQSADESFEAKSGDIVYGSIQKLVPESAMELDGVNDGSSVKFYKHHNPNQRDIFVYGDDEIENSKPEAYAPELRIEQQIMSINTDIDITSSNIGITAGTFRFDGKSIMTATQVITEKSDTARTIKEFERNTSIDWIKLFLLIKEIANNELKTSLTFEYNDIKINWKDSIIVDDESKKEKLSAMADKGWIPPYYYTAEEMGIELEEAKVLYEEAQALINSQFDYVEPDDEEQEEE